MEQRKPVKREAEREAYFAVSGIPADIIFGLGERIERMMELSWAEEETSSVLSIDILVGKIQEQLKDLGNINRGETGG